MHKSVDSDSSVLFVVLQNFEKCCKSCKNQVTLFPALFLCKILRFRHPNLAKNGLINQEKLMKSGQRTNNVLTPETLTDDTDAKMAVLVKSTSLMQNLRFSTAIMVRGRFIYQPPPQTVLVQKRLTATSATTSATTATSVTTSAVSACTSAAFKTPVECNDISTPPIELQIHPKDLTKPARKI